MKKILLLLIVMLLASCNTSKKVISEKSEVVKSTIEQESTKQEVNESNSVVVVDSSQVDKDIVSEYEINRTTIIKSDSTIVQERIKGKVTNKSKEKKAVNEVKKDSISNVIQADKTKAKINSKTKEETKITKKTNSTRTWWYLGLGTTVVAFLWMNKGKVGKWLIRFIRGK